MMDSIFNKPKRILYLTRRNARDKRDWSGTLYYMAKALEKNAGEVIHAGPYNPTAIFFILKVVNKISLFIFRKGYSIPYSYFLTLLYKYRFTRIIKAKKPDIIFAAAASGEMSQLKIEQPIIYLGDITFNLLKDSYANYQNLSRFSLWESEIIERKAFKNASALVFSSKWAASSAINDYNVPPEKVHIISFGANLDNIPDYKTATDKKYTGNWNFLFLAVNWERKGGEIAYRTFIELQNRGYDVSLTICGCIPPFQIENPKIKVIPYLNKNDEEDAKKLMRILANTNFLLVPSRSDCTPIVFCEANAFGIPVITSDVGGITSVIQNGINGHTIESKLGPLDYANIIEPYLLDLKKYTKLVRSSRDFFDKQLNWDHWGQSMNLIINKLIN